MPRPIRIQYENAFYHVMNHGRARQRIFHGDEFCHAFLKTLEEAHQRFDAQIHAYCLMNNHYHLLLQTPRANLDRIMRHVNGVYTQRFNRLKRTDGPLFRGRYKAILLDSDAYLLQVGRYIHRNPVEVKGAAPDFLDSYPWSSYLAYVNRATAPRWLSRDQTYSMLGQKRRYAGYRNYVAEGNERGLLEHYEKGNLGSVLGEREFRAEIVAKSDELDTSAGFARSICQRPDAATVVNVVAKTFAVGTDSVVNRRTGRQKSNLPRKIAMYYCQQAADMSLKSIADFFGLAHPGSVSPAVTGVAQRLAAGELKREVKIIERSLNVIYP